MTWWLTKIVPGVLRIIVSIAVGAWLGCLLEALGWMRKLTFLVKPLIRFGRLPAECGVAFLTALASPRAANSMLAAAYETGRLTRVQLYGGALFNMLAGILTHMRVLALSLLMLLGQVGLAYVAFVILGGVLCSCCGLLIGRYSKPSVASTQTPEASAPEPITLRQAMSKAGQRTAKLLLRVLLITVPLYVMIALLDARGVFRDLAAAMPPWLATLFSPSSVTVIAAHMSNVTHAAGVATEFLSSGTLTGRQVFATLVAGYALSLPLRTLRHNLPSAMGIFPGMHGLWIVLIGQVLRLLLAIAVLVALSLSG